MFRTLRFSQLLAISLFAIGAPGCADDDSMVIDMTDSATPDASEPDGSVPDAQVEARTAIVVEQEGLPLLANGFLYEGWAIIDGAPVSTGKFNVDGTGTIIDREGLAISGARFETGRDLNESSMFVLTIEPAGDDNLVPSETKFLSGEMSGDDAELTIVGSGASLGEDFSEAAGGYVLATPTDGSADTNEKSGVWFATNGEPALTLPSLPSGWTYEGWTVIAGRPISTGTFTEVDMADSGNPFSGNEANPGVPGEDFLHNAPEGLSFPVNLANGDTMVVVSVEPVPDDSAAPFVLKPLVGTIPASAEAREAQLLMNNGTPNISMTITLQ